MAIGFDEIHLEETDHGSYIVLVIKKKLDKDDYEAFVPQLEWLIEKKGAINLMVELVDFQGWTVGALWEDTKFALKHFTDIGRIAVIGDDRQWEKGLTSFIKPFTRAKVRYFDIQETETARKWLLSQIP